MASPSGPLRAASRRDLSLLLRRVAPSVRPAASRSYTSSSVNPTEVSHFNALASTWWDPHGSSRLLHLMNPLRHDFIRRCHAAQPEPRPQALRYLDVGCGGGIFAESAARLSDTAAVTAIDPSADVLAVARAHQRQDPALANKLTYLHTSIEGLTNPASSQEQQQQQQQQYDVLTLFEVIEHVTQPGAFLDACGPYVRPGGWFVMSTIARTWASWVTTKLVAEDLARIVPRGTHDWNQYLDEPELRRHFLARPGWNSPMVMGVVYVPGLGWREVPGGERLGNYFFAVRRNLP